MTLGSQCVVQLSLLLRPPDMEPFAGIGGAKAHSSSLRWSSTPPANRALYTAVQSSESHTYVPAFAAIGAEPAAILPGIPRVCSASICPSGGRRRRRVTRGRPSARRRA